MTEYTFAAGDEVKGNPNYTVAGGDINITVNASGWFAL
jgi:hypothetical protein